MRLPLLFLLLVVIIQQQQQTQVDAFQYAWTDWQSSIANQDGFTGFGKITTTTSIVDVSVNIRQGVFGFQISPLTDYYQYNGDSSPFISTEVSNRPTGTDIIQLANAGRQIITFSEPVTNPVLAIVSVNSNSYVFDHDWEVLSMSGENGAGRGYWGTGSVSKTIDNSGPQTKYIMHTTGEPHGVLILKGTMSTFSFDATNYEAWNGFTIGIKGTERESILNLQPAPNTVRCSSYGDPHIHSFVSTYFDCHAQGNVAYYSTGLEDNVVSVTSDHIPVPGHPSIQLTGAIHVSNSGGQVLFTTAGGLSYIPLVGPVQDLTFLPAEATGSWRAIVPGVSFIRAPGGVSGKFGVYIASAQLTVYAVSYFYMGARYWNLDIIVPIVTGDSGICFGTCPSGGTTTTTPELPNNCQLPQAQIEAACALLYGHPGYTGCMADVLLACDVHVAPPYVEILNPLDPAPLTSCPTGHGDPQFVGLQGQTYQVHGADNTIFALISTPQFLMNGLFTFIDVGSTCDYNNTACWSHPGTYISQIGFRISNIHNNNNVDSTILVVAGSHSKGLNLYIDDKRQYIESKQIHVGKNARVKIISHDVIRVTIPELFEFEITNSDMFFNIEMTLLRRDWLALGSSKRKFKNHINRQDVHLHGLIGITWKDVTYENGQVFEGDVMDYAVEGDNIFSYDFIYNQYKVNL